MVFDTELKNNCGDINDLALEVLKDSGWLLKEKTSLYQTNTEAVYLASLKQDLDSGLFLLPPVNGELQKYTEKIPKGHKILIFFSDAQNLEASKEAVGFQFLYNAELEDKKYAGINLDDNNIIINCTNFLAADKKIGDYVEGIEFFDIGQGTRYSGRNSIVYDKVLDEYVNRFVVEKDGESHIYHRYTKTQTFSPASITNFLVNSTGFENTKYWSWPTTTGENIPIIVSEKKPGEPLEKNYLRVNFSDGALSEIYNSGLISNVSTFGSAAAGESYAFRFKAFAQDGNEPQFDVPTSGLRAEVVSREDSPNKLFEFSEEPTQELDEKRQPTGYYYILATSLKAINEKVLGEKQYYFKITTSEKKVYFIEDVQFFKAYMYSKLDADGTARSYLRYPGGKVFTPEVKKTYYYYEPMVDNNIEAESFEDITWAAISSEPMVNYEGSTVEQYERKRTISASASNRFNILQTLAETFSCWCRFEICHDKNTGRIKLGKDLGDHNTVFKEYNWLYPTGLDGDEAQDYYNAYIKNNQLKFVYFSESTGETNSIGFHYGINLKSIQREVVSENIVTKLIVPNNSNEYADNGFCSIIRADENISGENAILNFDYYIKRGMLKFSELNNDLHSESNGYLGYYLKTKKCNDEIKRLAEVKTSITKDLYQHQSNYDTYQLAADSAAEQYALIKSDPTVENAAKQLLINSKTTYAALAKTYKEYLDKATDSLENTDSQIESYIAEKEALYRSFNQKYSRFIQEGTWISEDYVDDDLYYLDALQVCRSSAFPQVSYTINVYDLYGEEDFENYKFKLGDVTYIEDTEFFGWNNNLAIKTPIREQVVISEITKYLNDRSKNTIKVQNYKGGFEDLFQRITATTASLQYASGQYNRVTNVVNYDNTINVDILQNTLANNSVILSNSYNQSVLWDATGITTTDLSSPSDMVRIVGGGVFLSNDGGDTWGTGITGNGINAHYIRTGRLDASLVNIMNGEYPTFRWDSSGLSAYDFTLVDGNLSSYNPNTYVRYDRFGLYGIKNGNNFQPDSVDDVIEEADFSLTWKGFSLKTSDAGGGIKITSDKDIQVVEDGLEVVKLGRLGDGYGLRLSKILDKTDEDGNSTKVTQSVLETSNDGDLWLQGIISIGPDLYTPRVRLGVLETKEFNGKQRSKIFQVNNLTEEGIKEETFVIYDDGEFIAKKATIRGDIYATGGEIGGLKITENGISTEGLESVIGNTQMNFGKDGLSLVNGGLSISKTEYVSVEPANSSSPIYVGLVDSNGNIDSYSPLISEPSSGTTYYIREGDGYKQIIAEPGELDPKNKYFFYIEGTGSYQSVEYFNESKQNILWFDENNDLHLSANLGAINGTFSGTLEGASGSFKGEITAESGTIGGFRIGEDALYSTEGDVNEENPSIILYGKDGRIKADTIELGTGAEIQNYIRLGQALLCNPDLNNGRVLYVENAEYKAANLTPKLFSAKPRDASNLFYGEPNYYIKNDKDEYELYYRVDFFDEKTYYLFDEKKNEYVVAPELYRTYYKAYSVDAYDSGAKYFLNGYDASDKYYFYTGKEYIHITFEQKNQYDIYDSRQSGQYYILSSVKGYTEINNNGNIKIGTNNNYIVINGSDGSISSQAFLDNATLGWKIDNEAAVFNNIVAQGSIKSSVLEYGSVQAVGGILIVRPSTIITEIKTVTQQTFQYNGGTDSIQLPVVEIILRESAGFNSGDWCVIGKDNQHKKYQLLKRTNGALVLVNYPATSMAQAKKALLGQPLISLGKNGSSELSGDIGIGLNSSNNNSFVESNSISVFTLEENSSKSSILDDKYQICVNPQELDFKLATHVILGRIPNEERYGSIKGSYGLYADNALVRGSLISGDYLKTYSGISSDSGVMETEFGNDSGSILIWAGAKSTDPNDIQSAPFRVDTNGNLYAGKGYFKGSIITDATITASEIKTLKVTGWDVTFKDYVLNKTLSISEYNDVPTNVEYVFVADSEQANCYKREKFTNELEGPFYYLNGYSEGEDYYIFEDPEYKKVDFSVDGFYKDKEYYTQESVGQPAALTISNAVTGINFVSENSNNEETSYFKVTNSNLEVNVPFNLQSNLFVNKGNYIYADSIIMSPSPTDDSKGIKINQNSLGYTKTKNFDTLESDWEFYFDSVNGKTNLEILREGTIQVIYSAEEIEHLTPVKAEEIRIGEHAFLIKFDSDDIGYDLYIRE